MSHVMNTYARLPVAFERGQGAWLWDTQGRRYLDALADLDPALSLIEVAEDRTSVWAQFTVRVADREAVVAAMTRDSKSGPASRSVRRAISS